MIGYNAILSHNFFLNPLPLKPPSKKGQRNFTVFWGVLGSAIRRILGRPAQILCNAIFAQSNSLALQFLQRDSLAMQFLRNALFSQCIFCAMQFFCAQIKKLTYFALKYDH